MAAGEHGYGHTLVELITVVLLVGIVAVFAAPRFLGRSDFDDRGFFELSIQSVRYAQKLAQNAGCDIRVSFDGSGLDLEHWISGGGCAQHACAGAGLSPVPRPGGGAFSETAPPGVSVGSAQFCFDPVGRPRSAGGLLGAPVNVTVGGRTLTVEPETGYTRCTAGC